MKKKMLKQLVTVLMSLLIVFVAIPMEAVPAQANTEQISGDYVLIVNESFTESQKTGTISFDDTTPFGSSNTIQSLSVSEDINQQKQIDAQLSGVIGYNDTTPFGSSDAMQGLSENKDMYQQKPIDASADFGINKLSYNSQAVTTYNIGDTKTLNNTIFTVRGIGEHCYIWMDDITYNRYTNQHNYRYSNSRYYQRV